MVGVMAGRAFGRFPDNAGRHRYDNNSCFAIALLSEPDEPKGHARTKATDLVATFRSGRIGTLVHDDRVSSHIKLGRWRAAFSLRRLPYPPSP
jgi:hypothetical protein